MFEITAENNMVIQREYYYSYGNTTVSGEPEKKKHKLISATNNRSSGSEDNNNPNNFSGEEEEIRIETRDGFTSAGQPLGSGRPHMKAKWRDRTGAAADSVVLREEERMKADVTNEFSKHSRALKDNPTTYLVDYHDK
jgi:hypothetical protein